MFTEQVSTVSVLTAFIYVVGAVAVLFVVIGLGFIDMAVVRKRNVLDTWAQKFTVALVAGFATLFVGYAIWQYQFYVAFGIPHPLVQALNDWWIGGVATSTRAIRLNPKYFPGADVQQVFLVFFVTFSMATAALIHSSSLERTKRLPLIVMSLFIGLFFSPLVGYLCWGPVSPLTNAGVHDFEGVFPLYIFSGTWSLVLSWRVGPRRGVFDPDRERLQPAASNQGMVAAGVFMIFFAIPFIALGSTWIIPGKEIYGISMTQTGIGLILENIFCAMLAGGIVGAILASARREVAWLFLGPIAGAVMAGTLFDIGTPIQSMIFGAAGPLVAFGTSWIVRALGIDEPKVVPLALGPGIAGAILVGFVHWGEATGGYPGLSGAFAVGHAHITPYWQLVGVVTTMLISGVPALIFCLIFEKTTGLRVSQETELTGLDVAHWSMSNSSDDLAEVGSGRLAPSAEEMFSHQQAERGGQPVA